MADILPKTEPEKLPPHEVSNEDRDMHVAALRQIAQNIRNRNDQDTTRMVDGMNRHLDALDGNPEEREAQRLEAEQAKEREEKRAEAEAEKAKVA